MRTEENGGNVVLSEVRDFDLEQTLECGQCFHFVKFGYNHYGVSAKRHFAEISQTDDAITFHNITMDEYLSIWKDYFDLDRDYSSIKIHLLETDDKLSEAVEMMWGVRILNQEFFETLISFIISQNNQIPRIKQLVFSLSESYGDFLCECNGVKFYAFPTPQQLSKISEEELREKKTGFRAPYIADACRRVIDGSISEEHFKGLNEEDARQYLMQIKGVGEKVANCVLLFGVGMRSAFPVDVWIKRIMEDIYFKEDTPKEVIRVKAGEMFGEYGGYAQQYLFYYGKKMKIGTKQEKKQEK